MGRTRVYIVGAALSLLLLGGGVVGVKVFANSADSLYAAADAEHGSLTSPAVAGDDGDLRPRRAQASGNWG